MAGGEGSRLHPLTSNQPKPMMPLVNLPMMEHIVGLLRRLGFEEIVVTLHSVSGKEVTTSYAGRTADLVAKMKRARFKTVAGGSDLFKEIDGAWKRWDIAEVRRSVT